MDKIQKDINDALETARRLSLVKAIFGLSLYSLMVMIGTSLPISLFRMASEAGYDPAINGYTANISGKRAHSPR